jgi:hypothetical protein
MARFLSPVSPTQSGEQRLPVRLEARQAEAQGNALFTELLNTSKTNSPKPAERNDR